MAESVFCNYQLPGKALLDVLKVPSCSMKIWGKSDAYLQQLMKNNVTLRDTECQQSEQKSKKNIAAKDKMRNKLARVEQS